MSRRETERVMESGPNSTTGWTSQKSEREKEILRVGTKQQQSSHFSNVTERQRLVESGLKKLVTRSHTDREGESDRVGTKQRQTSQRGERERFVGEVGGWGRVPFSRNLMSPTPRRKWYLTTGRRAH